MRLARRLVGAQNPSTPSLDLHGNISSQLASGREITNSGCLLVSVSNVGWEE